MQWQINSACKVVTGCQILATLAILIAQREDMLQGYLLAWQASQ